MKGPCRQRQGKGLGGCRAPAESRAGLEWPEAALGVTAYTIPLVTGWTLEGQGGQEGSLGCLVAAE